jgi:hypothetical protein
MRAERDISVCLDDRLKEVGEQFELGENSLQSFGRPENESAVQPNLTWPSRRHATGRRTRLAQGVMRRVMTSNACNLDGTGRKSTNPGIALRLWRLSRQDPFFFPSRQTTLNFLLFRRAPLRDTPDHHLV